MTLKKCGNKNPRVEIRWLGYAVVGALGIVCSACGKSKGSKGSTRYNGRKACSWIILVVFLSWASPRIPTLLATLPGCRGLELAFLTHDGSMVLLYMVIWIPSIYPIHVSIYTIHGSCGLLAEIKWYEFGSSRCPLEVVVPSCAVVIEGVFFCANDPATKGEERFEDWQDAPWPFATLLRDLKFSWDFYG